MMNPRRHSFLLVVLVLIAGFLGFSDMLATKWVGYTTSSTKTSEESGVTERKEGPIVTKEEPSVTSDSSTTKVKNNETISQPVDVAAAASKPLPPSYPRAKELTQTATIVVQLSGELGNNLHHIAHGVGLQQWARDSHGIDANVVLRHYMGANNRAPKPKWKTARKDIQDCFPKLANWDFELGNSNAYKDAAKLQKLWLGDSRSDRLLDLMNSRNISQVDAGMDLLKRMLQDPNRPEYSSSSSGPSSSNNIRIPFVVSNSLDAFPMIDRYYPKLKTLFEFNNTACCALLPKPTDTVFHFRNYISELPDWRAYEMGFLELSPNRTAQDLFPHLKRASDDYKGDHVRITTRIPNQKARNYILALKERRGIDASLVEDQTGVQDFCFLKETQKELAGNARSTYVVWAALLGNATISRLYHVDNEGLRKRHADFWERFTYNWTNPELRQRIKFEVYESEEMDGFGR